MTDTSAGSKTVRNPQRVDVCQHKECIPFDRCLYGDHAGAGYPAPQRPRCDYCRAKLTLAVVRRFFFGRRIAWICRTCDSWEGA